MNFRPSIQNIICRNGLGHYQLIAIARPFQNICPSSYHQTPVHCWYIVSGWVIICPQIFLPEAIRNTLGKLRMG